MILNVICMLLCKRLPEGVVPFKTDDLAKKIKLLPLPKGMGFDQLPGLARQSSKIATDTVPLIEQFKSGPLSTTKFNTGEAAVVRIMIKHKKLTLSEIAEEDKQSLEKAKKAEKAQAAAHKRDPSRASQMSNNSGALKAESVMSETKSDTERLVEMD